MSEGSFDSQMGIFSGVSEQNNSPLLPQQAGVEQIKPLNIEHPDNGIPIAQENHPAEYLNDFLNAPPGPIYYKALTRLRNDVNSIVGGKETSSAELTEHIENTVIRVVLNEMISGSLKTEPGSNEFTLKIPSSHIYDMLMSLDAVFGPLLAEDIRISEETKETIRRVLETYRTHQFEFPIEPSDKEPLSNKSEAKTNPIHNAAVANSTETAGSNSSVIEKMKRLGISEKYYTNPTILRLIERTPPEILESESEVSFAGQRIRVSGVEYQSLQFDANAEAGKFQVKGTGRMVCDAGSEVIKIDRFSGNNLGGGIVEVLVWDNAQKNPWLKEQLLSLNRWGFVKDDLDQWHVYTVFPKIQEFYAVKVYLRGDWDTQGDVADLGGGITKDASGSNIGKYNDRWVIIDYNAPHEAIIFGGSEYSKLLQEYGLCIRESITAKQNRDYSTLSSLGERRSKLERDINKFKHEFSGKNLFE